MDFDDGLKRCVACGSKQIGAWKNKEKLGVIYSIDKCQDCGTGFMNPRPSLDYLMDAIYSTSGHGLKGPVSLEPLLAAEREYPNSTRDASTLVNVGLKHLDSSPEGRKALDIGSGYGFYSKAALEAGLQVTAVNPGKWENVVFRQLTGHEPIAGAFEQVTLDTQFDLVILSQVLEHLCDPKATVTRIAELLTERGIVAIAVPNFEWILVRLFGVNEHGVIWVPEHLNYFSANGLCRLLVASGFRVLEVRHVARIPYCSLSNRLHLSGGTRKLTNSVVRAIQWLPMRSLEALGSGLTIQAWATPIRNGNG